MVTDKKAYWHFFLKAHVWKQTAFEKKNLFLFITLLMILYYKFTNIWSDHWDKSSFTFN